MLEQESSHLWHAVCFSSMASLINSATEEIASTQDLFDRNPIDQKLIQ